MKLEFEHIIETFLSEKIGHSSKFLTLSLANALRLVLTEKYNDLAFHSASIGNLASEHISSDIRRDKIYWLDRIHENPIENQFLDYIDSFVKYLNMTCYTGITDYEFHYTLYEAGSFYRTHIDSFKDHNQRAFSMITYLNPDWKESDGGQLIIYEADGEKIISPLHNSMIFFKSNELPHEVMETHVPRMSITGWLKR